MKLGHILAPQGVSREMLLGAAVSAGAPIQPIVDVVERLGCRIDVVEHSIDGLLAALVVLDAVPGTERADTLEVVLQRIGVAGVEPAVAVEAERVYRRLFAAEAALHGAAPESIELHQLGDARYPALIVGTVASFHSLALSEVTVGTIALGSGSVDVGEHGILPIPAPATAFALQGYFVVGGPEEGELTGPTAAALLSSLTVPSAAMPAMTLEGMGRGAGRVGSSYPGCVTLLIGTRT